MDLFGDLEGALCWAIELGNRRLRKPIEGASAETEVGEERREAAVAALVTATEDEPRLVELCLVHDSGRPDLAIGPEDPKLI